MEQNGIIGKPGVSSQSAPDWQSEEKRREEALKKATELAKSISKPDLMKRFDGFDLRK